MEKTVLIIDDSSFMREFIQEALEDAGWDVIGEASDGNTGIELALEHEPDLITLDNVLPDMLGIDIAKILKKEERIASKIVMISALAQDEMVKDYKEFGIEYYLVKPFEPEDLNEIVDGLF